MTATAAAPEAWPPGERRAMKSETLKLRTLAGVRTFARDPGLLSTLISAPQSN